MSVRRTALAAAGLLAAFAAPPAAAVDLAADAPALFPAGLVGPRAEGGWVFETWRAPVLTVSGQDAQLAMTYNGLDDEDWPYARILQVLLEDQCGAPAGDTASALIDRTYDQPSLVEGVNRGGNAGFSFEVRLTELVGACQVTVHIEGARWHTVTTTIAR